MISTMASTRALVLPEILEAVLLQLPEQDLLLSQRISKTWRVMIRDSPRLQCKLFLRAESITDDANEALSDPKIRWNPLLAKFMTCGDDYLGPKYAFLDINPMRPHDDKSSSWRGMLVSQPAASCVSFIMETTNFGRRRHVFAILRNKSGVNLGQMHQAMMSAGEPMVKEFAGGIDIYMMPSILWVRFDRVGKEALEALKNMKGVTVMNLEIEHAVSAYDGDGTLVRNWQN